MLYFITHPFRIESPLFTMKMNYLFWLLRLAAIGLFFSPVLVQAEECQPAEELEGWTLIWSDDFSGDKLDLEKWEPIEKKDSHNNEKQYYLADHISVEGGNLCITATDEPMDGKLYRSGRLRTRKEWNTGRFEARLSLPATQGMWPAFWLVPSHVGWPTGGEIDILEGYGSNPNKVSSAYHWGADWKGHKYLHHRYTTKDADDQPVKFHKEFHVYAAEWEPGEIRFYIDGDKHFVVTKDEASFHDTPMSVVLNLAVGGWFDGDPDETTIFPQQLLVDYVRVWRKDSGKTADAKESTKTSKVAIVDKAE